MPNNHIPPDEDSGFTERRRMSAESPRTAAERSRHLAEEAREVRDGHREALETGRQERERLREAAETARMAAEEARTAAEGARHAAMDAVQATAETLQATLEHMKVVEEMRRTVRDRRGATKSARSRKEQHLLFTSLARNKRTGRLQSSISALCRGRPSFHGIRRSPPAGHAADPNAEHNRTALFMRGERNRGGLPPHGMPLKEALGDSSRVLILGSVWELLVMPEYDDARPLSVSDEFVDLETDKGILSHPLDFLTQCRVAIEKLAVQVDMNGNDVRLVVPGARQASDIRAGEHCPALSLRHLLDYHDNASDNAMGTLPSNYTWIGNSLRTYSRSARRLRAGSEREPHRVWL